MKFIPCYALTGGASGALDKEDGAGLSDGDAARVISDGVEYFYRLDASSGAAEASPTVISPDSNAGTKRWLLQGVRLASIQLATGATPTEFSTDGTLAGNSDTAVPTEKAVKTYVDAVGGLTAATFPGFLIRPIFEYKDTDEIYIGAGRYHHSGTAEQIVYWNSQLTYTASGLGNSTWYYMYLDDSAIVTHGSAELTATEFTHTSTAPTWSAAKGALYSGNDKFILAFKTDASGNILYFTHDGSRAINYGDAITVLSAEDLTTSFVAKDVSAGCPVLGSLIKVLAAAYPPATGAGERTVYYRPTGSASTTGVPINYSYNSGSFLTRGFTSFDMNVANDSGTMKVDLKESTSTAHTLNLYFTGYYLPRGA